MNLAQAVQRRRRLRFFWFRAEPELLQFIEEKKASLAIC